MPVNNNVFVNCPFDQQYRPCFEALIFTIFASGYRVRCALEDDDGLNIRFDKLRRLIGMSRRTIHDLSRVEVTPKNLPRFNMPFELGLAMGAKYFNSKKRKNSALIMVRKPFVLPAYLSDLGGNDPRPHSGYPKKVIELVTRYLHQDPSGKKLPGPIYTATRFTTFKRRLPRMAKALDWDHNEIDPYDDYRMYAHLVTEFLRVEQEDAMAQ